MLTWAPLVAGGSERRAFGRGERDDSGEGDDRAGALGIPAPRPLDTAGLRSPALVTAQSGADGKL
ncbi:hypothetical protein GCM10018781_65790 [Kitasatospora indigofera]|uniref:Uncharacterized protein n=1 Tax=Kitasatospora indigofera TaxID=67307 RepID=A0A919GD57_9ACTN|nr:hypothetical protein GCM10018781_65790 [Kitasatospora indigofera]